MSTLDCRVPVFEERIDNIVGIAYAMDLLDYVQKVSLPVYFFLFFAFSFAFPFPSRILFFHIF